MGNMAAERSNCTATLALLASVLVLFSPLDGSFVVPNKYPLCKQQCEGFCVMLLWPRTLVSRAVDSANQHKTLIVCNPIDTLLLRRFRYLNLGTKLPKCFLSYAAYAVGSGACTFGIVKKQHCCCFVHHLCVWSNFICFHISVWRAALSCSTYLFVNDLVELFLLSQQSSSATHRGERMVSAVQSIYMTFTETAYWYSQCVWPPSVLQHI